MKIILQHGDKPIIMHMYDIVYIQRILCLIVYI